VRRVMAPVFLIILAVEVAIVVINAVGVQTINSILWALLSFFPTEASRLSAQRKKTQIEYLKVRRELNATSSQDEFAKWAKLQRQHDKLLEQLEKMKRAIDGSRTKFDGYISALRFLLTRAPQFILPMWFAGQPVFWLPHGMFPWAIEWLISFPKAPLGSVSPATWQVSCSITIGLLNEALMSFFATKTDNPRSTQPTGPQPAKPDGAKMEGKAS
jgi:hypothetical protein